MTMIRVIVEWDVECAPDLIERENGTPIPCKTFQRYQKARREFDAALAELEIVISAATE